METAIGFSNSRCFLLATLWDDSIHNVQIISLDQFLVVRMDIDLRKSVSYGLARRVGTPRNRFQLDSFRLCECVKLPPGTESDQSEAYR